MRWALLLLAGCGRLSFQSPPPDAAADAQLDAPVPWTGPAYANGVSTFQASATTLTASAAVGSTDYLVVAVGWNDATSLVTAVSDSAGSTFSQLTAHQRGGGVSQVIFVAPTPAAAQTDLVTVAFNSTVSNATLIVTVFAKAQQVVGVPISSAGGTGQAASVAITTDAPNSLIIAAVTGSIDALDGAGCTVVAASSGVRHLVEDKQVAAAGAYIVGSTFLANSDWVVQTLALRPQ
jgi:hypothetical protein